MKYLMKNYFLFIILLCCTLLLSLSSQVFALSAPTNVSASDGLFTDKVRVTWDASPGASSYIVARSTLPVSQGGILTQLAIISGDSYHDMTASSNVTYYYWVKAQNETSTSKYGHDKGYCLGSNSTSFAYAVDNDSLTYSLGGDADWFWQNIDYYYDGDAAESGEINNSQESWIQTAVRGPGTLEFFWKVSSEPDSDLLEFYIDDIRQDFISGNIDWTLQTYRIPSKNTTLKWKYSKDDTKKSGADAAWVDKISWTSDLIHATPPPAPINLSATDGTFTDKVQVTWNAAPDATSYVVFRSELPVSQGGTMTKLATLSATSYDDFSGECGVTYFYWVKSQNTYGASRYSYDLGHCSSPLPAPTDISATDGEYNDKIIVSWQPSDGAVSYDIYRDNYPSGEKTKIGTTEATNYEDMDVNCPDVYYYFIKANNSVISSEFSDYDSGHLKCPTNEPPPELEWPTSLSATDGTYVDKIILSWIESQGATAYNVYRAIGDWCETKEKIATTSGTGYVDTDPILNNKRTYYYWVKALSPSGVSDYCYGDSGYLWRDPATPTNVQASDGTYWDDIKVTWNKSTGASYYEVYRGHSPDTPDYAKQLIAEMVTGNSYLDTNMRCIDCCENTDVYYYWVKAINPAGDSDYSNSDPGYTYRTLPDAVNVSASDGNCCGDNDDDWNGSDNNCHCIRITWDPVPGATRYRVYRARANSPSQRVYIGTTPTADPYAIDPDVSCGVIYYYWVRAVDAKGKFCPNSTMTGDYDTGYTDDCIEE